MTHHLARRCAAAALLALGLTACGSSTDTEPVAVTAPTSAAMTSAAMTSAPASPSAGAPASTAGTITIVKFEFKPVTLTVKPGAKVTVTNNDTTAHTVTAYGAQSFDTGTIAAGKTGTFTAPSVAGSYPYVCSIHQFMKGTLVVK